MREVDRAKDGVWETRRCRERVGWVEGGEHTHANCVCNYQTRSNKQLWQNAKNRKRGQKQTTKKTNK